ncbi:MAG: hypothetical protein KF878_34825, partial [Planctomycetes bacterium]|nr:hypothetical protein [Planctomycetota bacterium]
GDLARAVAACTSALALDPHLAPALALRAVARWEGSAFEPEDDAEALADLERALSLDPSLAWASAQVARVHLAWPRPEPALPAARRARDLDPRDPRLERVLLEAEMQMVFEQMSRVHALGFMEVAGGRTVADEVAIRRDLEGVAGRLAALARRAPDAEALTLLARAQIFLDRRPEALATCREAERLAPGAPRPRVVRAYLALTAGDLDGAAAAIHEAVRLGDAPQERQRARGLLRHLDREGVSMLDLAVRKASDPAEGARARLRRARMRALTGAVRGAIEDVDAALEDGVFEPPERAALEQQRRRLAALADAAGDGHDARWGLALLSAAFAAREGDGPAARRLVERALEVAPGLARVVKVEVLPAQDEPPQGR